MDLVFSELEQQLFSPEVIEEDVVRINKPLGVTSFTIVEYFTRKLNVKGGHGGTLDPLATGELILLLNKKTKLANFYQEKDKRYTVTAVAGFSTLGADLENKMTAIDFIAVDQNLNNKGNETSIQDAVQSLTNITEQVVPMYSATKQDGKKLYETIRKGAEAQKNVTKQIKVHSAELIQFNVHSVLDLLEKLSGKKEALERSKELLEELYQEINKKMPFKQQNVFTNIHNNIVAIEEALLEFKDNKYVEIIFQTDVSKGTYIRSLVEELGVRLNVPSVTFSLHRDKKLN